MYYLDSQRTVLRRDSSLIVPKRGRSLDETDVPSTARGQSTNRLVSESATSLVSRPSGSVRKELITLLFESMLGSIVESWEPIVPHKFEDNLISADTARTASEVLSKNKKKTTAKQNKPRRSRSRLEVDETGQSDSLQQSWWSLPDERAIIRFHNGNIYEGNISMKCMHGAGRFQWADGTLYLGQFTDNEINGKGIIQWKDDTWYEGDFVGNLRHGHGLYVDSRSQRSYTGGWYCGTKHGQGVIYYSKTFENSYDGEWSYNVRHGFGSREYCTLSGYKGEWNKYIREGKGLMIWPNHDFYKGQWKNGVMSGYGIYIWDAYYNNTMSLPSINIHRGLWEKGQRHGYGVLNLGFSLGSCYKGEFKNNKKHGVGKFVTNNGLILRNKNLFIDDNFGPMISVTENTNDYKPPHILEPYTFDICDDTVGLLYHIEEAIRNIDKQAEIRSGIIREFIENNKTVITYLSMIMKQEELTENQNIEGLIDFEEISLRKALKCYETDLKNIYHRYATICNTEKIYFSPVLIRLYLWQLYFDCNVHEKGLTLVEIDKIFYQNREWLAKKPHDPFERVYFWQFVHSIISVASKLYAKRKLPGPKPDTIMANAFRTFMETDMLPGVGRRKGRLVKGCGTFMPLNALYALYRSIGEPHTVRAFLCAARRPPHDLDNLQPPLLETPDDRLPFGRNAYISGDEMAFIIDEDLPQNETLDQNCEDLKLFNFGNLSSKKIIKIFSNIFYELYESNKIMTLDKEMTFLEFFEAFIACAEESIRVKDEEARWRERFSIYESVAGQTHSAVHQIKTK